MPEISTDIGLHGVDKLPNPPFSHWLKYFGLALLNFVLVLIASQVWELWPYNLLLLSPAFILIRAYHNATQDWWGENYEIKIINKKTGEVEVK